MTNIIQDKLRLLEDHHYTASPRRLVIVSQNLKFGQIMDLNVPTPLCKIDRTIQVVTGEQQVKPR